MARDLTEAESPPECTAHGEHERKPNENRACVERPDRRETRTHIDTGDGGDVDENRYDEPGCGKITQATTGQRRSHCYSVAVCVPSIFWPLSRAEKSEKL